MHQSLESFFMYRRRNLVIPINDAPEMQPATLPKKFKNLLRIRVLTQKADAQQYFRIFWVGLHSRSIIHYFVSKNMIYFLKHVKYTVNTEEVF